MNNRRDDSGTRGRARLSQRKRRIIDVLECSVTPGVILQNELRHRVFRAQRESGSTISLKDFNRSFNRTIAEYGEPLRRFTLTQDSAQLTAGIAARFGIWQLVEKGYASALPAPQACAVVVGERTFSVLGTLVDSTRALLYSGEIEQIDFVSNSDRQDAEALHEIRRVPWTLYRVDDDDELVGVNVDVSIRELNALPKDAVWEDGTEQCLQRRQDNFLFDR